MTLEIAQWNVNLHCSSVIGSGSLLGAVGGAGPENDGDESDMNRLQGDRFCPLISLFSLFFFFKFVLALVVSTNLNDNTDPPVQFWTLSYYTSILS